MTEQEADRPRDRSTQHGPGKRQETNRSGSLIKFPVKIIEKECESAAETVKYLLRGTVSVGLCSLTMLSCLIAERATAITIND